MLSLALLGVLMSSHCDVSVRCICSYAVNAQQRVKYANTCASFNNPDMITGIMQVSGSKV
jgi:hypothetical protein